MANVTNNPMVVQMMRYSIKDRVKDANMRLKLAINKKNIITGKYKINTEINDLNDEEKVVSRSKSKKGKRRKSLKSTRTE
eukprot:CAMPEP_0170531996 /NCGR_PEP_ID=MMETSP0209-20121228/67538_1 /TAXON_ID=665100 ORGANISM="Litonotus pictus, Strain P1" /NCGR_SAMPLE_ID=MMETSP0209 /ASSEMBLY_ACC=CAM_ASM_000301 /LENGTH=79 /DNA_ID=CAMNT_0010827487 /DNA_START=1 /DNA_END=237 /DNA_ORIENTATION=-